MSPPSSKPRFLRVSAMTDAWRDAVQACLNREHWTPACHVGNLANELLDTIFIREVMDKINEAFQLLLVHEKCPDFGVNPEVLAKGSEHSKSIRARSLARGGNALPANRERHLA